MQIDKVGVVGCGQMGSGIAQVAAMAGFSVTVRELTQDLLDKGRATIENSLARLEAKGTLPASQRAQTLSRLQFTVRLGDLADCSLVIEAITESLEKKKALFAELDGIVGPEAILASNTSSVSITQMMTAIERPARFLGLHFFNPVPLMKLVEVVKTIVTDRAVVDLGLDFARRLGKDPILTMDRAGFIVNRLLIPYLMDSVRSLEEGFGTIEDIDKAMKLGCNHPMGPLTLLDFVGIDTSYYIAEILFEEYREARFAPPPLLKRMVLAGMHGRKVGKGFYDYKDPKRPRANDLLSL